MIGRPGNVRKAFLIAVLSLAAALPGARPAVAGPTDLLVTWTANSEPDIAGYRVSYGTVPGSHPTAVDAGNITAWRATGLTTGIAYYFVVEAYDGAGNYSAPSAEVIGVPGGSTGPALSLAVADSPDPIGPGANLTYTLAYANGGGAAASAVVITDAVPANTAFVSATAGGTLAGGTVTWTPGSLAAGATGSVQMIVRVNSPLANGTIITNGGAGIDSAETTAATAAAATTTVNALPVLSISKTDGPDPVAAGSNITYTLSYANGGSGGATGVVVTDTVPANTTFVSATAGGTLAGGTVTWTPGSLAAGATGSVQMVVRANSPLASGTIITNGAYAVDCAETAAVGGAAVTTGVTSAPVLALVVGDAPDPVTAGANITYTLGWSNSGNMNASATVLTAGVPANATFVSATAGGTQAAGTVSWTLGALAAGASGSAQMVVRVASPLANGTVITHAGGSLDCAETLPVAGAAVATTVIAAPVLTLSASDAPDPVAAGSNITYTLGWSNTGTMNASAVLLTTGVPANTTFVSATAGGAEAAGTVTWNIGALATGASGAAQMVVRVASPLANGTAITHAGGSIDSAETPPAAGVAIATTVTSAPLLALTRADAPDPVTAGGNLTYTLTFANNGTADATSVVMTDTVPANTTFVSATLGGTQAAGTVSWNLGTLAAGATGSAQVVVRVASPLANGTTITSGAGSLDSAQTNPAAGSTATTTVTSAPILAVSQTDAPDPVSAGANLTYALAYGNSGNASATGTILRHVLPAGTTYVSATPVGTLSAGVVTWSLGTLAAGATGGAQLTVRVASPLANGTLITSAGLSIDCNETAAVAAATITTSVGSSPSFNLTLTDSPDPVAAGANLTYTVGYTNAGNANATGTVLTAAVPANTTFVSATAGGAASTGTVAWNLGAVNAAVTGSVQMVVRVASPLANGTTITSGALSVDCAETAAAPGPSITTTVTSAPVLTIGAADAPDPVQAGANLTYTLTYANNGNADATGVVITDTLPANTTFVSVTAGGGATGSLVTWNVGALAAGASGSVQLVARVASPLNNGTTLSHAAYSIDSAQTAPVAGAAVTTTVQSAPVLSLSLTDAPDPVAAGANIGYTLAYANTGNMNATGTTIADTLPANTIFVSATGGGAAASGVVNWSVGTLNAGVSGSVQLVVRVASPLANGTVITNGTCSIDSAQTSPLAAAAVTTTATSAPVLTLTRTEAPDPVAAGANLTYTLSYANTGSAAASAVTLTSGIPADTTFVSATAGGALSGGTVTWSLGALAAGASGSAQMVVRVTSPLANGTIITGAAASIDSAETAPVGAGATVTTVTSAPVLSVSKTDAPDPVAAGATLTYTIAYANNGNTSATGVVLTDRVPANATFVSATNGGALSGSTITWMPGTLAAGGSGSAQVVVRVASPLANGTNLIAGTCVIDSAETAAVTAASISTTVASSPVLSILAGDAPDPVAAGADITYTLTYANAGNAVATQTIVTAVLPANTTFVSATGGGVHTAGSVSWSVGSLGASAGGSVQVAARVATPLPNGTVLTLATYSIDSNQTSPVPGPAVTTAVVSNPILSLVVTDSPDPVLAGTDLTYTLTYANGGNAPATGAALTASLPAGTTFVSATGGALAGGQVTWSVGTIGAGLTGSARMVVHVPSSAVSGAVITASGWTLDSAETAPVTAATAATSVTEPAAPIVTAALEMATNSIYFVRGAVQTLVVSGSAFADGAVLNLSPDITVGATTLAGSGRLTAPVAIAPGAALGARTLTLTNPDGRSGSLPFALEIVKQPDGNNDCKIDGVDLNQIARSWNSAGGEAAYAATVDFDGDGYVGPDDLTIFVKYFAGRPYGCP